LVGPGGTLSGIYRRLRTAPSLARALPLAELNSLLSSLTPIEMRDATAVPPAVELPPFLANYIAAMVEYGCSRNSIPAACVKLV